MTYRGFVDDMATVISCNFGEAAYLDFGQVVCRHGLRDCDAEAPIICEICWDNQRQGGEACDGSTLEALEDDDIEHLIWWENVVIESG